MIAFIGVRISWLILARNIDLACVASSATSRAWARSACAASNSCNAVLGRVARRADLGLGALALGDVTVVDDDPAARHRVRPHLDDAAVGTRALGRILSAGRFDQPAHFGFDIDLAVLAMRRKVANVVAKARPLGQQSVGQIEKLLEIAVPRREPQLGVEHCDAVAHVVEGHAQLSLALADFAEQPGIVHRNDRLRREVFQERDLFFREWPHLASSQADHAEQRAVFAQRQQKIGARTVDSAAARVDRIVDQPQIGNVDKGVPGQQRRRRAYGPANADPARASARPSPAGGPASRRPAEGLAVEQIQARRASRRCTV